MNDLSRWEVETRLIYALLVAGKSAKFAERKLINLLAPMKESEPPFAFLRRQIDNEVLDHWLRTVKTGSYKRLNKAIPMIINLDVKTVNLEELEAIHGIGPKTARFFLLWTRPGVRYAALDTHILKWLREIGYDAPKSTPSGKKYAELENIFLAEADKRKMTPRDLDWQIWSKYAHNSKDNQMEIK